MTHCASTFVKRAIFSLVSLFSGVSDRQMRMSGWMPISRSCLTLCWVGLVLISPAALMYGTSVTWTLMAFFFPLLNMNWRIASRKGRLSMSPTVPPISVMITSYSPSFESASNLRRISSVMCGITCTVAPR